MSFHQRAKVVFQELIEATGLSYTPGPSELSDKDGEPKLEQLYTSPIGNLILQYSADEVGFTYIATVPAHQLPPSMLPELRIQSASSVWRRSTFFDSTEGEKRTLVTIVGSLSGQEYGLARIVGQTEREILKILSAHDSAYRS